ncbi:MAG: hypothetical protein JOZ77_02625 [Candidatus Eremiobacteraeota bacterium]|nr:hypothetical protein [Candidatus Eremiobacteraeota bacterium]
MYALLLGVSLAQATSATLMLSASSVSLNPAQQQTVVVTGATPPLAATLDRKLVNVNVSADGGSVTLTATQETGSDVLHLIDARGVSADLPIRVAFNAGTIVAQTTLTVTGDPLDSSWLSSKVVAWVASITKSLPGADPTIGTPTAPVEAPGPGQSAQFVVPVQISGNGRYFDQTGTTTVTVDNVVLPPFAPALLFYDDDPEHVTQDGVLFRGSVTAAQPTRIFYYHDAADDPHTLVVALSSASQDPTSVQLVEASAGPNMDVMHVGQTLTKNFLLTKARSESIVVNLPADEPFLFANVPMAARQLVSGAADVRVLSGGPVIVTVLAVSGGTDPRSLLDGAVLPGDGHHRTGVFRIAGFGTDALDYTAGGADATVVVGDTEPTPPSVDPSATGRDYGDYGILHTIDLTINNPTSTPTTAYLFFKPLAGPARGSFLIDGNFFDVGCVRVANPYQITSFELKAGERYHTVVQTMTDGGSFYPAEIGLSATPPQPSAPPINAPDGCFPKPDSSPPPL